MSAYYRQVMALTGLTGMLASIPCILLYRGDFKRRYNCVAFAGETEGGGRKEKCRCPENLGNSGISHYRCFPGTVWKYSGRAFPAVPESGNLSGNTGCHYSRENHLEYDSLDGNRGTFGRGDYFQMAGISEDA